MMSPWYQRIFPTRLAPHRQAVQEFITTRHGYRLATSTGGVLTGRGADIILIDDPLKPEEALSAAQRQAANNWFVHTLYSRLNDKRSGAIVIIMQRLHEDDLVGHVLRSEEHTSELQSRGHLVCRLLLEKKNQVPGGRPPVAPARVARRDPGGTHPEPAPRRRGSHV